MMAGTVFTLLLAVQAVAVVLLLLALHVVINRHPRQSERDPLE